jgi:hypothetical protein
LLGLLNRWRAEAEKNGHRITRIAVAFEAGHDGFWLARWLTARYYLSSAILNGVPEGAGSIRRVPAVDIEGLVIK